MNRSLASSIAVASEVLRGLLDAITVSALEGGDAERLIREARELADLLTEAVSRLEEGDQAEEARRMAAHLAANLTLLEELLAAELAP